MKTKKQISVKLFAFIMALLMLLVSLPVSAFASAINTNSNDDASTSINAESETVKKDVIVLEEDETLRDKNTKHFKLSDGTTKAVVYSQAVHYKDSDGKWVDIDNALTLNGSEYSSNNKSEIKFANKSGSTGLVSIKDGDYKIDFTPLNTNKVSVVIENPQKNNSRKFEDVSVLNNLVSKAIYADIYDGIDIEYILVGNNIKENIIVKEKQDSYTFSFELKLNKLSAELVNGAIILYDYDSGEQVYEIPVPYMYDANNVYSDSVEYSLVQNNKWKYTFTVTADAEWINADDRAFPITIDPAIGVSRNDIVCFYETEGYVTQGGMVMHAGDLSRIYFKLASLPDLPNSAYITDASINMYCNSGADTYIGVYNILSDWSSSTIKPSTMNTVGVFADSPVDYVYIEDAAEWDKKLCTWNIIDIVHEWYNNANYGLGFNTVEDTYTSAAFSSMTYDTISCRPFISIEYRDMKGVESYWSYISQSAGLAGNGSINLATGNLMFEINTITTTDSLFSFTPSIIYNSAIAGEQYEHPNAMIGYWGSYAAKGFKMNFHETLIRDSFTNSNGESETFYVWADSDGTEHYFLMDSQGVYRDEDGLQLTLTIDTENDVCTLKDSTQTERIFVWNLGAIEDRVEKTYYLSSIKDRNGNKLNFVVDGWRRPEYVRVQPNGLNEINMINMLYNSSNVIYAIWNTATGDAVLFRHSDTPTGELSASGGEFLREALYLKCDTSTTRWSTLRDFIAETDNVADGITVNAIMQYGYDSAGHLTYVKDTLSGRGVYYTYDDDKVICIEELGKDNELGQAIIIDYYSGYTEVLTSGTDDEIATEDDIINVYSFDKEGRVVSTYSTNLARTEIYGATVGEYENSNENAKNNIKIATSTGTISPNYLLNGNFELSHNGYTYWNKTTTGNATVYFPSYTVDSIGWDNSYIDLKVKQNGEAAITQNVALTPGNYTLSLKLDSSIATDAELKLKVTALDGTGEFVENVALDKASSDTEETTINKFAYLSFKIEGEYNTSKEYKVGVYLSGTSNTSSSNYETVTVDNLMLAKSTGMQNYSWLNNGSFEQEYENDSSGIGCWITDANSQIVSNNESSTSAQFYNSLKIEGTIGEEREVNQILYKCTDAAKDYNFENGPVFGTVLEEDQVYIISGFAKAPEAMSSDNSIFALKVEATYYCYGAESTYVYYYDFNAKVDDWQYITGTFIIPDTQMLSELSVSCVYSNNYGEAYFDNIAIRPSDNENFETTQYYYYDNGKLRAQKYGWEVAYYAYDDNGNTTDVISNKQRTQYLYENNLVVKEIYYKHDALISCEDDYETVVSKLTNSSIKSVINYEYNAYGQIVKQTVYDPSESTSFETENTYDVKVGSKIFGALIQTTNSLDEKTRYFFDSNSGRLLANISTDNTGTYYTYDDLGNLIFVQPAICSSSTVNKVENSSEIEYVYNANNLLEKIIVNDTEYKFTYDAFGNQSSVSIGDNQLMRVETNDYNGKTNKAIYANGIEISYEYDELDRVVKVSYDNPNNMDYVGYCYEYEYDSDGNLSKFIDGKNNKSIIYRYDHLNRLIQYIEYNENELINEYSGKYEYNDYHKLYKVTYSQNYLYNSTEIGETNPQYQYVYNYTDGSLWQIWMTIEKQYDFKVKYTYDDLSRFLSKSSQLGAFNDSINVTNLIEYGYVGSSSIVNEYKSTITVNDEEKNVDTFKYMYDEGYTNITIVKDADDNILQKYTYDSLDRLIREDNRAVGKTFIYEYDDNGNILNKKMYPYTLTNDLSTATPELNNVYGYTNSEWRDQLTIYNGKTITYDLLGNPKSYRDYMNLTWEGIGILSEIKLIDDSIISYTYNDNGIRTSKTVNGVTHNYMLDGTIVVSEQYNDILILYLYDESDSPVGFAYRTSSYAEGVFDKYLFTKNFQGDIIGIYDELGNEVVTYKYDAWGMLCSYSYASGFKYIAEANPFRYRGYFYDIETGFYYLNSRYYDPQVCRFVGADATGTLTNTPMSLTDKNLYAYCDNNPVMRVDNGGQFWDTIFDVVSLAFSIVDVCMNPDDPWAWVGLAADAIDLIPFVTGVGEVTRAINTTRKVVDTVAETADTIYDATKVAKRIDNVRDTTEAVTELHRPYIRKSTREAVEKAAAKNADGKFLDANTGIVIEGKYDLGHTTGHEFWREKQIAQSKGWTQKQFNDYMNNPAFYRIEDPHLNRSHKFEMPR